MFRTVPFVLFALLTAGWTSPPVTAADPPKFSTRDKKEVFYLATGVTDEPFADAADKPPGWDDNSFRPNATRAYHLYVFNPTGGKDTFVVELDAGVKTRTTIENLEPKVWTRVKFAATPPAAPAPATTATAAVPAAEPPPAGRELTRQPNGFPFAFRLLDKNGKEILDKDSASDDDKGKPYGRAYTVALDEPSKYLTFKDYELKKLDDKTAQVSVSVTPKKADDKSFPPSTLKLSFPKRGTAAGPVGPVTRDGVYERTLAREPNSDAAPELTLRGSAAGFGSALRTDVAADGVGRAFILKGTPTDGGKLQPEEVKEVAIRVYPVAETTTAAATKPTAAFPVRVEVDNPPAGSAVELRYRTVGDTATDENEVIRLGGPRHEQMWVDVTADGIAFATRSKDWVKAINLADARGKVEVVAVITEKQKEGQIVRKSEALVVSVDATPPEPGAITFTNLKDDKQLEKGQPLKLSAIATDLDSEVKKAVFFLGVPTDDGKVPADAVQVKGDRVDQKGKVSWTAALPLPADKRGELTVGVVFTDTADNSSPPVVKRIELVDAPAGGKADAKPGTIEGKVVFGETPQPGLTVTLADGEGKPKDTAKTNDKGKFAFKDVPPGAYKLTAGKTDPTSGLSGAAEVTVKAGEKATPTVELKKVRK